MQLFSEGVALSPRSHLDLATALHLQSNSVVKLPQSKRTLTQLENFRLQLFDFEVF